MKREHFEGDSKIKANRTRGHYWIWGVMAAIGLFLYPFPSTGFLYRNAEVLENQVRHLKGATVVLFLDPSFYYKFTISPNHFRHAVSALGLQVESDTSLRNHYVKVMKRGPLFWNFWWWRPRDAPEYVLYTGDRKGNHFYFLYNRVSHIAYLYIQNT
jgi:hypothetical protein